MEDKMSKIKKEINATFRRLLRRHHPDKMLSSIIFSEVCPECNEISYWFAELVKQLEIALARNHCLVGQNNHQTRRIAELEAQLRKYEEEKTDEAQKTLLRLDEAGAPDLPPYPVESSV